MPIRGLISILAVVGVVLSGAWPNDARSQPPEDTPFGVTFNTPKLIGVTLDDILEFFDRAEEVGDTVMLVWQWNKLDEFDNLQTHAEIAHNRGLKLIIQISNTSQGASSKVLAPDGFAPTFTDPATRQRYIADVLRVAALGPNWLNISPEVNLLHFFSNDEFMAYSTLYPDAYDAVKAVFPNMKVGVSYLDLPFIGQNQLGLPDILGPRDFIGITTYPDGRFETPDDIPAGWYTQFRNAFPDDEILFSEVGWGSRGSSLELQRQFVSMLPQLMAAVEPSIVMWALLYEVDAFCVQCLPPEAWQFLLSLGVDPVELFEKFNSLGLIAQDGSPKPAFHEAQNLDFSVP